MLSVLEHYKQHKHPLFVSMVSGLEHSPCARGKNYHLLKKGTFRNCSQARSYCHEKAQITTPSKGINTLNQFSLLLTQRNTQSFLLFLICLHLTSPHTQTTGSCLPGNDLICSKTRISVHNLQRPNDRPQQKGFL